MLSPGGLTDAHALAHMLNTEPLFFEHFDDLKLKAGIETAALPCHANFLGWWIVHLPRCLGKLDYYTIGNCAITSQKFAVKALVMPTLFSLRLPQLTGGLSGKLKEPLNPTSSFV